MPSCLGTSCQDVGSCRLAPEQVTHYLTAVRTQRKPADVLQSGSLPPLVAVASSKTGLLPGPQRRRETVIAAALAAIGLTTTVAFGLVSPEGIHHFDDLVHYLYAKWAWKWPAYLVDGWGRPGFTGLYFLPARFGWPACRVFSALITAGSAWFAFRIAQRMAARHAWAVVAFCYAQPLFFQLAQTTLTETVLAFYLTLAVYLAHRGRWSWSAAFISLGMVTRHEAIIFLPIWVLFAWRRQVALWRLWPIVCAPLAANALALWGGLQPGILKLLQPTSSGQYGHGGWLSFFVRSMEASGPGVMVLAMIGIPAVCARRGGAMIAACVGAYFGAHTAIRALGLFDSGGYARFLVPISPLVAVAALIGWQRLWTSDWASRRRAVMLAAASMILLWVAMERQLALAAGGVDVAGELPGTYVAERVVRVFAATLLVLAVLSVGHRSWPGQRRWGRVPVPAALVIMMLLASYGLCHPLARPAVAAVVDDLQAWLADHQLEDRGIISAHPWLNYAAGHELAPHRPSVRERLQRAPLGTLFVWDRQFAASQYHGLALEQFQSSPAFRLLHHTPPAPHQRTPYLTVFEKIAAWAPGPASSSSAPALARALSNPGCAEQHRQLAKQGPSAFGWPGIFQLSRPPTS